jgi:hypothetical protein
MPETTLTVLAEFAESGEVVKIDRGDRVLIGTLHPNGNPNEYHLRSGKRGRPAVIHADDVVSIQGAA